MFQVSGGSITKTTTTSQQGVAITIPDGAGVDTSSAGYAPATISVMIGLNSTVTWVNQDTAPHTVTAKGGSFNSLNLEPGKSFTYTFTVPGTYTYYCLYHSWMKGEVKVVAMH